MTRPPNFSERGARSRQGTANGTIPAGVNTIWRTSGVDRQLVSVVVLNYNYGRYLAECLDSVLAQDYDPIEIVVVDDGSTDQSRNVLASYTDRVTCSFKANGGMVSSMNHGFRLTRGSIVVFLDADDYLLPGAVAAHVRALREPDVVRSQCYMTLLDESRAMAGTIPDLPAGEGDLRQLVLERGPGAYVSPPNSGNAWSRAFLEQVFPLPERLRTIGAETFLMDAAPLFGRIVTLSPEPKAAYRRHGASQGGKKAAMTSENICKILAQVPGADGLARAGGRVAGLQGPHRGLAEHELAPPHPQVPVGAGRGDERPAVARDPSAPSARHPPQLAGARRAGVHSPLRPMGADEHRPTARRTGHQPEVHVSAISSPREPGTAVRNRLINDEAVARPMTRGEPTPHGRALDATVTEMSRASARPLVSVVVLSYNYGRFLRQCIDSVLAQDHGPLEVIVVDDGSTDDSAAIINSYGSRVIPFFKVNGGEASAMNCGFALSRGAVVMFVDSDDYLLPGAVRVHVRALGEPGTVRSQSSLVVLHGDAPSGARMPGVRAAEGDLCERLLQRGPGAYVSPPNSGNAWARSFLERIFPIPENPKHIGGETFLMDTAALFGRTINVAGEPGAAYRVHDANTSHTIAAMTAENISKVLQQREARIAWLEKTAASLGHAPRIADWDATNWRALTLRDLHARLFRTQARRPRLTAHLKPALRVEGHRLKGALLALVLLAIRLTPVHLSRHIAALVIELRYM